MRRHRGHGLRAFTAGALAATALTAAGCGSSGGEAATSATPKTVDDAQVEQGIKDDLSTSSAKVTGAKCPGDVAVEQGDTFTCTVTFDNGATGKATVTQQGRNRYTYALKPGSVQVPGETADAAVEKSLAAQGAPNATVNCPSTSSSRSARRSPATSAAPAAPRRAGDLHLQRRHGHRRPVVGADLTSLHPIEAMPGPRRSPLISVHSEKARETACEVWVEHRSRHVCF